MVWGSTVCLLRVDSETQLRLEGASGGLQSDLVAQGLIQSDLENLQCLAVLMLQIFSLLFDQNLSHFSVHPLTLVSLPCVEPGSPLVGCLR